MNANNPLTKQRAILIISLLAIIGGGMGTFTKIAVAELPIFSFVFIRFIFASIIILPFFIYSKPRWHKQTPLVLAFSLLMSYNVTANPFGVALTTATISQVIYSFVPLMVAALSFYFLKERFSVKKISGLIIGFTGATIIILLPALQTTSPFAGDISGNLILLSAAASVAIYTLLAKHFLTIYTPLQLTSIFVFTTTILVFFFAMQDLSIHPLWWKTVSPNAYLATLYTGSLGTIGWYLLYQYVIKRNTPTIAAITLYLQPIAAFGWAAILLGEQLTFGLTIGTLLTFIGIYLTTKTD